MITAEELFNTFAQADNYQNTWELLSPVAKYVFEKVAAQITAQYITPLQGGIERYQDLVEAYHNLTDHCDEVIDSEWHEEKAALDARELVLLGEELAQEGDTLTPETEAGVAMAQAIRAQGERIIALQEVVKDFAALLEDEDLMIEDCSDGWYYRKEQALAEARRFGEEPHP